MVTRHQRAGIDDRWTRKVVVDGKAQIVDSPLKGKVTRWRVRWVESSGKERTKSFPRKVEAQRFLDKLTADIQRGDYINAGRGEETFGAVAEQWIKTKSHRKPSTLSGYQGILRMIALPKWGDVALKDIEYEAYATWLGDLSLHGAQRGGGLSASRITQVHQLMGAVLMYAVKTGRISKSVAAEIKRSEDLPTPTEKEPRFLTHEGLLALAYACEGYTTQTLVLGYCGPRFGEVAALRGRHCQNGQLAIHTSASYVNGKGIIETTTKTNRSRRVPVPQPVWEMLEKELPANPNDLVFPGQDGGFMSGGEYRWRFDKACKKVGITDLTPHDLRHTCASLAISSGANVKVVQRMLGHATAAMTLDLYGHLFDDDLTAVGVALGEAMKTAAVSLRYPEREEKSQGLPEAG